jgi:SAM-dependent methyltransferase
VSGAAASRQNHYPATAVSMHTHAIQRQYDEVIAPHYDADPQSVIGDSLDRALAQVWDQPRLRMPTTALRVLDLGMGTGRFLTKLAARLGRPLQPSGLDLSEKMLAVARRRVPDLVAVVDDARNLDAHFAPESFDLVCTHFIAGFIPAEVLAPLVWDKLAPGGYWSFVGGMRAGFPALRRLPQSALVRLLFRAGSLDVGALVSSPADRAHLARTLEAHGFAVRRADTFTPEFRFADFEEFLEVCYRGGWLTPFIESLGVHRTGRPARWLLDRFVFPMRDHHVIEVMLAEKVGPPASPRARPGAGPSNG